MIVVRFYSQSRRQLEKTKLKMKTRQPQISRNKPKTFKYTTALYSSSNQQNVNSQKALSPIRNICQSKSDSLRHKASFQKNFYNDDENSEILSTYLDHIEKTTSSFRHVYLENHFKEEKEAVKYLENNQKTLLLSFEIEQDQKENQYDLVE